MNYKATYDIDNEHNCGRIRFNNILIMVDLNDMTKIINCPDKFTKFNATLEPYPYYMRNLQRITFLKYLYELNDPDVTFVFKNNNIYDLQRDNVSIQHKYHPNVIKLYSIVSFNTGHHSINGKDAYIMKNPIWTTDKNKLIMYCEKDTLCELCTVSYEKIVAFEKEHNNGNKITFYKHSNSYIYGRYLTGTLSIYQIIIIGGKDITPIKVNHIDNNSLNNSINNLQCADNSINNLQCANESEDNLQCANESDDNLQCANEYEDNLLGDIKQHKYHTTVAKHHTIVSYQPGHHFKKGIDAYVMKNPIWTTDKNRLIMFCEKDTLCELCPLSYNKVLEFEKEHNNGIKMTFYKQQNGYVYASYLNTALSIHQIITGCYGNGKGTKNISVDHIDRNPLNNSWENLRIATREEQEQNSKGIMKDTKRARSANSKELPEGITQELMGRSIYYNKETYGNHGKTREFFRVIWEGKEKATSKAEKFTIIEKLAQAKQMLSDLENDSYVPPAKATPKYIRLIEKTPTKLCLEYERRILNDENKTIKQTMKLSFTITDVNKQQEVINEKLNLFKDNIKNKYDFDEWEF